MPECCLWTKLKNFPTNHVTKLMSAPETEPLTRAGPETLTRVGHVAGVETELLVTRYTDRVLVCVTQLGKFGSWVQLEKDTCAVAGTCQSDRPVYSCTVLLGQCEFMAPMNCC